MTLTLHWICRVSRQNAHKLQVLANWQILSSPHLDRLYISSLCHTSHFSMATVQCRLLSFSKMLAIGKCCRLQNIWPHRRSRKNYCISIFECVCQVKKKLYKPWCIMLKRRKMLVNVFVIIKWKIFWEARTKSYTELEVKLTVSVLSWASCSAIHLLCFSRSQATGRARKDVMYGCDHDFNSCKIAGNAFGHDSWWSMRGKQPLVIT